MTPATTTVPSPSRARPGGGEGQVDWAHTATAERSRVRKARRVARWLYDQGITAAQVPATPPGVLRAWARAAGCVPPSTPQTWVATLTALQALQSWAEANPGHPAAARRRDTTEHLEGGSSTGADPGLAAVLTLHPNPAPARGAAPKGWGELAVLSALARPDARCATCRAPALTAIPARGARHEWRCAAHPPTPGQWGHHLDWTPTPAHPYTHPDRAHRCYDPRCPAWNPAGVDARTGGPR